MQAVSCASRQLQLLELKANYGFLSRLNSQPPEPGIIDGRALESIQQLVVRQI